MKEVERSRQHKLNFFEKKNPKKQYKINKKVEIFEKSNG